MRLATFFKLPGYLAVVLAVSVMSTATAGVIVDANMNNGDLEDAALAPWTAVGGSVSSAQNRTPGGSQSLEIDLTAPNAFGQWKPLTRFNDISGAASVGDTVEISAWVLIPTATQFGSDGASLNLPVRSNNGGGGNGTVDSSASLNLVPLSRDVWHPVSATFTIEPTDSAPTTPNVLTMLNSGGFNLLTTNATSPDGMGGNVSDPGSVGYSGSVFIDDIEWIVTAVPEPGTCALAAMALTSLLYGHRRR